MKPTISQAVAAIAADHRSGATVLGARAVALLRRARTSGRGTLVRAARSLCHAQPSMASVWNAAAAALAGDETLETFARQTSRAPGAIARLAQGLIDTGARGPATVITWSASRPVRELIERLASGRGASVRCAEGRPALEGRQLAAALAGAGISVELFPDGALASAVDGATAVVVGADAVTPEWFVNKAGTRALALAAATAGVPTYVLAGRDKCLGPALGRHLALRAGPPGEIWARAPRRVSVQNPYFERIPLRDVAAWVTDAGVATPTDAPEICRAAAAAWHQASLARLLRST